MKSFKYDCWETYDASLTLLFFIGNKMVCWRAIPRAARDTALGKPVMARRLSEMENDAMSGWDRTAPGTSLACMNSIVPYTRRKAYRHLFISCSSQSPYKLPPFSC